MHATTTDSVTAPASAIPFELDRRFSDRRKPQPLLNRYAIFGGRRKGGRRAGESRGLIVDRHGPILFLAVVSLVALNFLDAFFTMLFLSHGGTELNPFIDWVIREVGVWGFLAVKSVGIGLCAAFLTLTKNFYASRIGLVAVVIGYSALLGWHFSLLDQIPA